MKLSIVVPVFNEEKTILQMLEKLRKLQLVGLEKEIIIVDDCSIDKTQTLLKTVRKNDMSIYTHEKNLGKGAAVRTGIEKAKGDYIIIQDADLEYDPNDIPRLLEPILEKKAEVVYGTRLARFPRLQKEESRPRFLLHYLGNRFLSLLTSILYGQWLTDMETCYKLFPKKALDGIKLNARGFEFEPEITAKLLKRGYHILEIPIKTIPRGYEDGKKLNTFRDGMKAFATLVKYRWSN